MLIFCPLLNSWNNRSQEVCAARTAIEREAALVEALEKMDTDTSIHSDGCLCVRCNARALIVRIKETR